MSKSVANLKLVLGSIEDCNDERSPVALVGIKLQKTADPITVSQQTVHTKCGTVITYRQSCPHCHSQVTTPVKGSPAPTPTKARACENRACLKPIEGQAKSAAFCEQEGCNCFLKDADMQPRYSRSDLGANRLVSFSEDEAAAIDALRLSKRSTKPKASKKGGDRLMVIAGKRVSGYAYPFSRVDVVYQIDGEKPQDIVVLDRLKRCLALTGEQLVVHFVLSHDESLTASSEHIGLLHPTEDAQALILVVLHAADEVRPYQKMPDVKVDTAELDRAIDGMLDKIPVLTSGSDQAAQDTAMRLSVMNVIKAKVSSSEYTIPPVVDRDGSIKAAIARLAVAVLGVFAQVQSLISKAKKDAKKPKKSGSKKSAAKTTKV